MNRTFNHLFSIFALLAVLLVPAAGQADFLVTNMLAEVGVVAGSNSDGVGGHETTNAFLSVSDGVPGTADFQFAEALFQLTVDDQSGLADFLLTYDSQVLVMTGGVGNAAALSNGIIVFSLTEEFEVTSLTSDSTLSDSLGEAIVINQGATLLLDAGIYSLSFGSSAMINNGDDVIKSTDFQSGQLAFNAAAIPEPAVASILCVLLGLPAILNRRRHGHH